MQTCIVGANHHLILSKKMRKLEDAHAHVRNPKFVMNDPYSPHVLRYEFNPRIVLECLKSKQFTL